MHLAQGHVAIIDPACSIGDGWADMAMLSVSSEVFRMSVSIPAPSAVGVNVDDMGTRMVVYQIYHVLNHVNLFGGGYLQQLASLSNLPTSFPAVRSCEFVHEFGELDASALRECVVGGGLSPPTLR